MNCSNEEYSYEVASAIKHHQEKIEEVKKTDEDVKLIRDLFPDISIWVDKDVNCHFLAKSMDEVKSMLKTFAKAGVLLDHFNESETCPTWCLKGKNVLIRICPDWQDEKAEGATCRLVQIGEDVVTYPRYKLVCDKED